MLTGGWRGGAGAPRILHRRRRPEPARPARRPAARRRLRDPDRPRRRGGAAPPDGGWPDLLIVDMMMARMDGLTLAREIKARADLPIIVLSAIDTADSKADLLEEVAEDYVTKPYHYPELRARIRASCAGSATRCPGASSSSGPSSTLELPAQDATVRGQVVQLTPDGVAAALRPRRESRQHRQHGDAARPRLGRHRRRRPVVRLGDHAPAAPEDRARSGPSRPPRDGSRDRLPARRPARCGRRSVRGHPVRRSVGGHS